MTTYPRPDGHHTITPGFQVHEADRVIGLLERAFGGHVVERHDGPGGSVAHAEVMIGDSVVMLGEPMPGTAARPASLSLYVDDGAAVDATYRKALEEGAVSVSEPQDQFYGYRSACVEDAGGNRWTICAIVEQLTRDEIERRMAEMMKGG